MPREYSVADARNHLSRVIRDAETGGPVRITRRGKSAAVLISEREFRELTNPRPSFWSAYQAYRKLVEIDGVVLERSNFQRLRDPTPGRDVDL